MTNMDLFTIKKAECGGRTLLYSGLIDRG